MPLTLEQYANEYLDTRELPWPTMPKVEAPKARPHVVPLSVRAVLWNVYGTLLAIPTGELQYEAVLDFVTDAAFDKTIKEFNMWNSMSRKPGAPSAYMKEIFKNALTKLRLTGGGGERYPEVLAEKVWDDIVNKLMQKEYKFDASLYGPQSEFVKKIAYFFHASIQGTGCYPGAAEALRIVAESGRKQGLLADAQCFTMAQLQRGLNTQESGFAMQTVLSPMLRVLSCEHKARKPSETLFDEAIGRLSAQGISASETLHVGTNLERDIVPAKKAGMKTALFAGDKVSLIATPEQLKDRKFRPDILLTELPQIAEVFA